MLRRSLLSFALALAGVVGMGVVTPTAAYAATPCSISYLRMSVFTNGYVDGLYIYGPLGIAQTSNCAASAFEIAAQPASVGGVQRVGTPGSCTSFSPEPVDPNPNTASCNTVGYGGVSADITSYPYITLTGVATAVGTDGSRQVMTRTCTVPLPSPDGSSEYCRWGTPT